MTPTTQAGATSADETVTIPAETMMAALRAFERFGGSLRYTEEHGWHTNDRIAMVKALEAAAIASPPVVPESVRRLSSCSKEEIAAWEEWARGRGYDMHEHPLHYLFLDTKTDMARQGWKAGIAWALSLIADAPPSGRAAEGGEDAAERQHRAEVELQEIADGAYGDNPMVRGAARDRLAAPTPPASAGDAEGRIDAFLDRHQGWMTKAEWSAAKQDLLALATAPAAPEPAAGGETLSLPPEPKPIKGFSNRAGQSDADDEIAAELEAAGIETYRFESLRRTRGEVKTVVRGELHGWSFERAWRYWIARGPGIELSAADVLYAAHPETVRVDGHCGCPTPREWFKGLAVGTYHVDSAAGLKGLADTIRHLVERAPPPSTPTRADAGAEGRRA